MNVHWQRSQIETGRGIEPCRQPVLLALPYGKGFAWLWPGRASEFFGRTWSGFQFSPASSFFIVPGGDPISVLHPAELFQEPHLGMEIVQLSGRQFLDRSLT